MTTELTRVLDEQQLIMSAAGIGTWRYEARADRFRCDSIVRELLGLPEEQDGSPMASVLDRIDARQRDAVAGFLAHRADGDAISLSFKTEGRKGESRSVLARARYLEHVGEGGRLVGILLDNSENEALQETLRRSEERFRMLANGVPNAFVFFDRELVCQFANEEFAARVGKNASEIVGRHASNVFGPTEYHKHGPHLEAALKGTSVTYETIGIERDGVRPFLRICHKPALDERGEIKGIFREATDVTELKRLEQQVRSSEGRFRMLANGVPSSFIYLGTDLHIQFANDAFLRNVGRSPEEVRGRHIREVLGEERYAERKMYFERACRGETVSYEAAGPKGDDSGFFHYHYQPSSDATGKVQGIFCVATDISDRRRVELALEAKQAELVRSNRDLEQFAYVASHDLKAPLRAIEVLVEWLREDLRGYEGGDVQENLTLLERRTKRLGRLLDDLLGYSRVGRKIGDFREVDCNELVRDVIQLAAPPEGMSIRIDGPLPKLETYPAPLEQVFRNLIGNAIKHHPGPAGNVVVSCEEHPDCHLFSIEDDGEGIPAEYAERVFQMFQTLRPRDEVEGSGMGLAIVNRIVEWQGGRVWFEPASGATGTVFKFQWRKNLGQANGQRPVEEAICRPAKS